MLTVSVPFGQQEVNLTLHEREVESTHRLLVAREDRVTGKGSDEPPDARVR